MDTDEDNIGVENPVVRRMLDNFKLSSEAEADNRKRGLNCISFYRGGKAQWDEGIYKLRDKKRPTEAYNQIPKFIRQITNVMRMNKAQTRVVANTDGDVETATLMEDLLRSIQSECQADVAYDMAGFNSTVNGWGYWRWLKEYENNKSFDQILRIAQVPNPFKIYDDPFTTSQDRLDRRFLIEVEDIRLSEFNRDYKKEYDSTDLQSIGDAQPEWAGDDMVRVAEYWELTHDKGSLWKHKVTGETTDIQPTDEAEYQVREVLKPKVTWYKCTGLEVLEQADWDGVYIPYVFVAGETVYENGKIYYSGAVEPMIPPQKLYNYAANAIVEAVSSQPLAPYIAAVGQIDGKLQKFWDNMNTSNTPWLPYNPVTVDGQLVGAPQRNQLSADITSLVNVLQMAQAGFNEASGQYQANIGAASNEKSGVAIQRRNQQSEVSTFHFPDNLTRALNASGVIALDLIQKTYDGERMIKLLKENGDDYDEKINGKNEKGKLFDFTIGIYDIVIDSSPGYSTKRQEGAEAMIQLASTTNLMEVAPDIVFRTQDWEGAQEISERYKTLLPPALQDNEDMADVPKQVQGQMKQMGLMIQQLQQQLQAAAEQLQQAEVMANDKQAENQAKLGELQVKVQNTQNQAAKDQAEAAYKAAELEFEKEKFYTETALEKQRLALEEAQFQFEAIKNIQQPEQAESGEGEPNAATQQNGIGVLSELLVGVKDYLNQQAQSAALLNQAINTPKTATKTASGEWVVAPANMG